jgi:hypothetical protein
MTKAKLTISDYIEIYVKKRFTFKLADYVITTHIETLILHNDNTPTIDIQNTEIKSIKKDSNIVDVAYMNAYNELYDIAERYTLDEIENIANAIAKTLTVKDLLSKFLTDTKISYTGRCITDKTMRKRYGVILHMSTITHCAVDYNFSAHINDNLEIRNMYYTHINNDFSLSFSEQDSRLIFNKKEIEYNCMEHSYFLNTFAPNYKKVYAIDLLSDAFKNDYIAIPDDTLTQYTNKKDIVKTFKANNFKMSL